MVADKGKKSKLAEEEVEQPDHHIDGELVLSVEKLQELQDDLEKINEEACEKVLEVEQKYNEKRRPAYIKRNEIIKSIPDFWLTIFLTHPALGDVLSEEDQKIFKYLNSLDVEDFKDVKSGYAITFFFNENPYFEDSKLEKTFTFFDEGSTEITGTRIKWRDGKETANGDNHEKKGNKRPFAETSFFSWFGETEQKDGAELHDEIAEIIKEDLWPNPLKYFQNDADEEDSDGDGDGHGDGDGDGEEEEDEEEEEENGDEQDDEDEVEDDSEEDN